MIKQVDNQFFDDIAGQIKGLADDVLPYYSAFSSDVANNRITDILTIERELDYMLSFCFDDTILLLYKKILRKINKQYPDTVKCYVDAYYEMYGIEGSEIE